MSPVLTLVLLPFEASKEQDQGLLRCPVTAIIKKAARLCSNHFSLRKYVFHEQGLRQKQKGSDRMSVTK